MARFDAIVIGGGIAGASVAFFLSQHRKVLLLERESGFGYHSTGRSAAEWTAAHCVGVKRGLALLGEAFFDAPPRGFTDVPLLRRRGNIVFATPGQESLADAFFDEVSSHTPKLRRISPPEALAIVPFLRRERLARCYYEPDNAEIDVNALHQGFLRGLRARGGLTRGSAEMVSAARTGGTWRVELGTEAAEAPTLVNAAGAWADVVADRAGVAPLPVEPRRRTALTFSPGFDVRDVPPVDEIGSGFYFKASGNALMVCAGDATPSEPCDAQPDEFDVAVAVDRFEQTTTLEIRKIASRWAGLRTFVRDEQPVAGFDADAAGFFWLTGQGGAGIMTSPGLGQVAAALIEERAPPPAAVALGITPEALSPRRLQIGR
jgi:D-arginine dehydrogenase